MIFWGVGGMIIPSSLVPLLPTPSILLLCLAQTLRKQTSLPTLLPSLNTYISETLFL